MNKKEYIKWCQGVGYLTINDWNRQKIGNYDYYFILNPKTDLFALIRYDNINADYQVLVQDWTDFNGYAEQFHIETLGVYK